MFKMQSILSGSEKSIGFRRTRFQTGSRPQFKFRKLAATTCISIIPEAEQDWNSFQRASTVGKFTELLRLTAGSWEQIALDFLIDLRIWFISNYARIAKLKVSPLQSWFPAKYWKYESLKRDVLVQVPTVIRTSPRTGCRGYEVFWKESLSSQLLLDLMDYTS